MSTITIDQVRPVRSVRTARGVQPVRRVERPSAVRLTRRGRVVVLLLGLVVALAVGVVLGAGSVATERPGTPDPSRVVTVAPATPCGASLPTPRLPPARTTYARWSSASSGSTRSSRAWCWPVNGCGCRPTR